MVDGGTRWSGESGARIMVVQCTDQYGVTRFYRAPRWVQRKLGARWGRLTGRWYW